MHSGLLEKKRGSLDVPCKGSFVMLSKWTEKLKPCTCALGAFRGASGAQRMRRTPFHSV